MRTNAMAVMIPHVQREMSPIRVRKFIRMGVNGWGPRQTARVRAHSPLV